MSFFKKIFGSSSKGKDSSASELITETEATQKLAQLTMKYIYRNNMMFGQQEFIDVISNACFLEYLEYNETISDLAERSTKTNLMIYTYLLAAEKTQKGIYSNYMDEIVRERVFNWFSPENKSKHIYVSSHFFDIDIKEKIKKYDPFDFSS